MNDLWEVFVLEYASSHEPWVGLVSGMYDAGMVDLPFSFVLARRGGRNVLIDSGFMRQGDAAEFPLKFGVSHWISPLRMLAELGVAPAAVSDIVVTHAHFDHFGSIGEFPNARIHIQKSELMSCYEALALPKRFAHLSAIVDPANIRMALEASIQHRVNLLDGDRDDVLPGIHVRLGPGHTPGHQFVIVETACGRRVISGDCLYTTRQLTGHAQDGVYVPLNNATGNVWDQLRTLDRVSQEIDGDPRRLIVMHDVGRWKEFPPIAEVEGFRIVQAA
ncbi:MAG: N-acyl homoserine lactonase family protein [Propionivibrio sp.]